MAPMVSLPSCRRCPGRRKGHIHALPTPACEKALRHIVLLRQKSIINTVLHTSRRYGTNTEGNRYFRRDVDTKASFGNVGMRTKRYRGIQVRAGNRLEKIPGYREYDGLKPEESGVPR